MKHFNLSSKFILERMQKDITRSWSSTLSSPRSVLNPFYKNILSKIGSSKTSNCSSWLLNIWVMNTFLNYYLEIFPSCEFPVSLNKYQIKSIFFSFTK